MRLGREVGLRPREIVLVGDLAPLPQKGAEPTIFGPCLLWPDGCMDQDATWHGGRSWPRPHCARWGPSCPPPKVGGAPLFLAHVYCGHGRPSQLLLRSLWPPYGIGQAIIFLPCGFFFYLLSFFFFSSPNLSWRRLDVYHTSTHDVALG